MTSNQKIISASVAVILVVGIGYWVATRPLSSATQPSARSVPAKAANGVAASVDVKQTAMQVPSATPPSRKFADLDVLEANAILKEIELEDHTSIFQRWLDAGRIEKDRTKQLAIGTVLASALRNRTSKPGFLTAMQDFVADNANSADERRGVIGIFSAALTRESIDFLIFVATTRSESDLKQLAIAGISKSGNMRGDGGGFHEERSPALEQLWRETHDSALLNAAAVAMAQIGAPAAVDALLSSALLDAGIDDARKHAALGALEKVYLENAVPPIAALLAKQTTASPSAKLAGGILVNIGQENAANALLNWLQNADESAAPLAREFVAKTRSPALLKAWNASLDKSVVFRSEAVRSAIRDGTAEYQRGQILKSKDRPKQ